MTKPTGSQIAVSSNHHSNQQHRGNGTRKRHGEPHPFGGNFILMPSLLDYLTPDLTLPEQYFYQQQNDDGMGPEKGLMYAVLKDGIRCFYKHVGATRRKYRKMSDEAEQWLLDDGWDYPFAFRVICDTLGIDADCLRRKLFQWKEAELERRRLTGDSKTRQVGRSPFPTPLPEIEQLPYMEAEQRTFQEIETQEIAGRWPQAEVEQISLEELRYESLDNVA